MKSFVLTTTCTVIVAISSELAAADPPQKATGAEAKAAAAEWLDGLGEKGLVLVKQEEETGFRGRPIAGSKSVMFTLNEPGWRVTLGFSESLAAGDSVETVRKRLKYVALDQLPTPGLELPGWNVRPQTPVSSFKDGVEILQYGEGRIKLRIRTRFFAIYGRDPSVLVPADAPSPEGSYFQIRKNFPLDLTLDVPLSMGN